MLELTSDLKLLVRIALLDDVDGVTLSPQA